MAKGSDLDRVTSVVLREMRNPILVLVTVHALGVGGMVLIPGVDPDGNPVYVVKSQNIVSPSIPQKE